MASVQLAALGNGTVIDQYGNALTGRAMFVYARDTTTQVQVYQDEHLGYAISQPLVTNASGGIPGYIASGQSIDIVDQLTGARMQAEALNASAIGGAGSGDLLAANNLSDLVSPSTARTNLGLGSAATQASSAFDASGTAVSAVATETSRAEAAEALLAPIASPGLTGAPTAPTQTAGDNSTKLSTTAYADRSASNAAGGVSVPSGSGSTPNMDGTGAAGSSASFSRGDHVHPSDTSRAPLASPSLTGAPTAPTATALTNSTTIATTAYADSAVAVEKSRAQTAEGNAALKANNLSDLASASTARTNLGLGSAATSNTSAFDAAGAAAAVEGLPLALSGATSATRYVGGTASGAPTSGTFSVGDFVITQAGSLYICTTAGSPGTWTQVSGASAVSSVFTRTGAVVAASGDYSVSQITGAAPTASPTFTGTPAAPTAAVDTSSTQVATTAFVLGQTSATAPVMDGTASVGSGTRYALSNHVHPTDTSRAALASPTLTGTPAAPTASAGTNTTQLATTAFVATSFAPLASPALTGTPTVPTATAGTSTTQAASTAFVATSFAPLASPTLTGTPAAPTAAAYTNTTQVATTAMVQTALLSPVKQSNTTVTTLTVTSAQQLAICTAQASALTITLSGTPADGQELLIRLKATGAYAITWTSTYYAASGVATLPSTTVSGKTITCRFIYDAALTKYVLFAVDATGY